ncbi:MAG TPA: SIMPL domain-containing protein [Enhygromyxa sp.]|nr:SIMPL domain-containing protein [Enhygromyxa sp.]
MLGKRFEGSIESTGSGEIMTPPDEAVVMLDVLTEADTAAEAVAANAKLTQAVIDAVMEEPNQGVTTTGLGVFPVYQYDRQTNVSTIIGFRASNGVRVVTRPSAAGQVYDAGIQAGANVSSGISYRIKNEAPLREEALRLAVKQAFAEAQVVADTAGVELLGARTIVIDPIGGPIVLRAERMAADAAPTPVIPEDLRVRASVRITFRTRVG